MLTAKEMAVREIELSSGNPGDAINRIVNGLRSAGDSPGSSRDLFTLETDDCRLFATTIEGNNNSNHNEPPPDMARSVGQLKKNLVL